MNSDSPLIARDVLRAKYDRLTWSTIPIPKGGKGPNIKGWGTRQFSQSDFEPGCNIGLILGPRSNDTVDVDLDCSEALALAPTYLPHTGARFGRKSKPLSHWLYTSPGALFDHWHDPLTGE